MDNPMTHQQTAAMLREAARRARAYADNATSGPWIHEYTDGQHRVGIASGTESVAFTGNDNDRLAGPDADHIAVWNPVTAYFAVELLESVAADMEVSGPDMPSYGWPEAVAFAQAIIAVTGEMR